MKHLIIYAHPNPNSLNGQFKDTLVEHLQQDGQEIIVRDLYAVGFNPVLSLEDLAGQRKGLVADDVAKEQEFITWSDSITFIYPIWWTGLPAMMKGYVDRVFSYGFAYSYTQGIQKGLLTGRNAVIINTHGKSHDEYHANGLKQALSLTSDQGIYTYTGLKVVKHLFFEKADRPSPEDIEAWKLQIKEMYTN